MKTKIKEIYAYLSVKFTSFVQENAQKIAFTIALMLLLFVTTLLLSFSANSISFAEIEENSKRWKELESERVSIVDEQKHIEKKNSLLRELKDFTTAENQK